MKLSTTHKPTDLQQNPQSILNNQLNNSSSKMQFSFAQSSRFNQSLHKSASPDKFYDLPSLWSKKSGKSIGRSNRIDFGKQNVPTPSPNKYQFKSSFIKQKHQGISMGLGRDVVKYRDMFGSKLKKTPQPATYHPLPVTNTKAYSIAQRLDNSDNKWIKQVPGPGNYAVMQLTNSRNKKIISKYLSAQTSQFSRQQRASLASKSIAPGPNKYQIKSQSFDESLYDKPYASRIGCGQRRGLSDKTMPTPGPGSYKVFSQFLK